MNASYFVNNFHTIFSSYTPLTNISVWWFDALQIQPQLDIVSSICKPKIEPTAGELDTLWILNHTFLLDLSVQSSIRSCVERHGLSALAYYNDKDPNIPEQLFTINPYSPGSRRWFLQQSQSLQSRAVGFIYANHRFIWKYSPEQSIQVLQYLSLQNSVSGIREEFEESSNSLRFLAHPLEYTAWFQNQNDFKQQTLILQICAIAEKSTNELDQLFAVLRIYASTNLKVQETMKDCLKTRDLSITDAVRGNFMRTTENPMTTWFASRSLDVQLSTIDYFFQGQTIDISIVFTIQKLLNIFTTYLTFLDSMWMTTNPQVKRIRVHIDSYTSYNLTADLMNFQMPKVPKANVVWFLSQNATRQLEIVDEMCALLEVKQRFTTE
ncbi:hypothetical protein BDR26DRAFT_314364 [Obelidium mucronatum]|nr:hypothetical protein BDR26DRAFT_314364 [Obelidium mucronatum]